MSSRWKDTLLLRLFALARIPMLWYLRPVVEEIGDDRGVVRIPLRRRTRNHLGSMYFGVLCAGADMAGGLIALKLIRESGQPVSFVFKDFKAEFLKRAEHDVLFVCEDGAKLKALVDQAISSSKRTQATVAVSALVPSKLGPEPAANFELTISLKRRSDG